MTGDPCYVYLIVSDAPAPNGPHIRGASHRSKVCKVGISRNPSDRLATLQTASPHKLKLLEAWRFDSREQAECVERRFHKEFSPARLAGEWFFEVPNVIYHAVVCCVACIAREQWGSTKEEIESYFRASFRDENEVMAWMDFMYGEVAA